MRRRPGRAAGFCALLGVLAAGGDRHPVRAAELPSAARQLLDRIAAVVEGQVILLSDVRLFLDAGLVDASPAGDPVSGALGQLIERRLILEEAARYVLEDPASDEVAARLRRIEQQVGGSGALEAVLAAAGHSPQDLEQVVRDDLRIERYLVRRFPLPTPSSAEAAAARQALIDDWLASLQARGRVVRVLP